MPIQTLTGTRFAVLLRCGLANLRLHETEINRLNVFPVPDGDTGTNMRLTLEGGLQAVPEEHLGRYAQALARGMLFGARGNSGVILSQIFKGMAQALADLPEADAQALLRALREGYRCAYRAVLKPTEGTILTVAREGTEQIAEKIAPDTDLGTLFSLYLDRMRQTLRQTPAMLPVLAEAGVVDSGGEGFVRIFEGMEHALTGAPVPEDEAPVSPEAEEAENLDAFTATSTLQSGYCLTFLARLQDAKNPGGFDADAFRDRLLGLGESVVLTAWDTLLKVHIHTHTPGRVMDAVQEVGEFLRLHLDNMDLSGRDPDDGQVASASPAMPVPRTVHKAIAYVAVAPSDEMADLFRQCGADAVLRGGQTMNPSAAEFVSAFDTLDADSILVLPNNKNVYGAATQAAALSGRAVTVLPAYSPAQGYFALSSVLLDCTDPEEQQAAMLAGMEGVCSLSFARAVRSCTVCGVCCREGELLGLAEDTPVAAAPTLCEVLPLTLAQVDGIADKAICVLFPGAALPGEEAEALAETIRALYPHLEVGLLPGGQPAYDLMAGLL